MLKFVHDLLQKDSIKRAQGNTAGKSDPAVTDAKFPGSREGWLRYLMQNLRYPEYPLDRGIQGRVVVQFSVGPHGQKSNIDIFKSVAYYLDEEALRIIRNTPNWKPATREGKPVQSVKRQPIVFAL